MGTSRQKGEFKERGERMVGDHIPWEDGEQESSVDSLSTAEWSPSPKEGGKDAVKPKEMMQTLFS